MSAQPRRHISVYRDRLQAAQIASRMLISKRDFDRVTRQALEGIALQRDDRVNVLEWVTKLEGEGGAAPA